MTFHFCIPFFSAGSGVSFFAAVSIFAFAAGSSVFAELVFYAASLQEIINSNKKDMVLSEVRNIYKAPAGWGIIPKDASKHHARNASKILESIAVPGLPGPDK